MSVAVDSSNQGGGLTFAHTVAGSDTYLLVGIVGTNASTFSVADMTYNGKAMTRMHRNTDPTVTLFAELWGIVAPDAGTNDVVITMDGSGSTAQGAISFTGVDQSVPFGGANAVGGLGTMAASPPLGGVSGGMLAGIIGAFSPVTISVGTEAWNDSGGDAMAYMAASEGAESMEWSLGTSNNWIASVVQLRPVGAPHDNEYGNRRTR